MPRFQVVRLSIGQLHLWVVRLSTVQLRWRPAPAAPVPYDADEDIYGDGDDEESGATANPLRDILASIGARVKRRA